MTANADVQPDSASLEAEGEPGTLYCYRHPDRETWVRCGRCDRPICTKCAMLGPVGMRCKQCGKLKHDPLTSFTPVQLALASGVALGGGLVGGVIAAQIGFFLILLGPLIGGFITEAVFRVVGFKHGPVVQAIVYGGIALGALGGVAYTWWSFVSVLPAGEEFEIPFSVFLTQYGAWTLIYVVAACIGARSRMRG